MLQRALPLPIRTPQGVRRLDPWPPVPTFVASSEPVPRGRPGESVRETPGRYPGFSCVRTRLTGPDGQSGDLVGVQVDRKTPGRRDLHSPTHRATAVAHCGSAHPRPRAGYRALRQLRPDLHPGRRRRRRLSVRPGVGPPGLRTAGPPALRPTHPRWPGRCQQWFRARSGAVAADVRMAPAKATGRTPRGLRVPVASTQPGRPLGCRSARLS